MASFRKRNGLWQVQVRSIHAGATSKSFHRKSDAERWAKENLKLGYITFAHNVAIAQHSM